MCLSKNIAVDIGTEKPWWVECSSSLPERGTPEETEHASSNAVSIKKAGSMSMRNDHRYCWAAGTRWALQQWAASSPAGEQPCCAVPRVATAALSTSEARFSAALEVC